MVDRTRAAARGRDWASTRPAGQQRAAGEALDLALQRALQAGAADRGVACEAAGEERVLLGPVVAGRHGAGDRGADPLRVSVRACGGALGQHLVVHRQDRRARRRLACGGSAAGPGPARGTPARATRPRSSRPRAARPGLASGRRCGWHTTTGMRQAVCRLAARLAHPDRWWRWPCRQRPRRPCGTRPAGSAGASRSSSRACIDR